MAKISEVEIPALLFDEQGAAPSTPSSSLWKIYFKSDGLYIVDDAGTETGPLGAGGMVSEWETYTPTWGATSSAPSLGDGTIFGRFRTVTDQEGTVWCEGRVRLTWGSSTTGGSGPWNFTVPSGQNPTAIQLAGVGIASEAGVGAVPVVADVTTNGNVLRIWLTTKSQSSASAPFTWGENDFLEFEFRYRVAE